ncbi:hypothetical protein Tco_0528673 [Tanacetum coccineum]
MGGREGGWGKREKEEREEKQEAKQERKRRWRGKGEKEEEGRAEEKEEGKRREVKDQEGIKEEKWREVEKDGKGRSRISESSEEGARMREKRKIGECRKSKKKIEEEGESIGYKEDEEHDMGEVAIKEREDKYGREAKGRSRGGRKRHEESSVREGRRGKAKDENEEGRRKGSRRATRGIWGEQEAVMSVASDIERGTSCIHAGRPAEGARVWRGMQANSDSRWAAGPLAVTRDDTAGENFACPTNVAASAAPRVRCRISSARSPTDRGAKSLRLLCRVLAGAALRGNTRASRSGARAPPENKRSTGGVSRAQLGGPFTLIGSCPEDMHGHPSLAYPDDPVPTGGTRG